MNNITQKNMIKKGDAFVCIETVIMNENPNDIGYDKGRIYYSEKDGCITDNQGFKGHTWNSEAYRYFVKLVDREIVHNERVEHPSHYTWLRELCGIEVIDITRHLNFNLGNVIKYVLRSGRKAEQGISVDDKAVEDLKKARFYLDDEIKRLEL